MIIRLFSQIRRQTTAYVFLAAVCLDALSCAQTPVTADAPTSANASVASLPFPADLALISPLDFSDAVSSEVSPLAVRNALFFSDNTVYSAALESVDRILNTTDVSNCAFDPDLFFAQDGDASCFGPELAYYHHPDADSSDPDYDGTLPGGDLGLWSETDAETGEPCAAAELNARMDGLRSKSLASLTGLATLVCVVRSNGYDFPSSSTLDLTADMNALGLLNLSFSSASISHTVNGDGNDEYAYELEFTYETGLSFPEIAIAMRHVPGESAGAAYSGQISYLADHEFSASNCPSSEVTINGSLQYENSGADSMIQQARSALFCGHGVDGRDADNLVDPSDKYDPIDAPNGWGDNFNVFTAQYDTSTLAGNYSYAWQAGPDDGLSRVFNVAIPQSASETLNPIHAFYGYGDDIASSDGGIQGFVCNWAGPGSDQSLQNALQYQLLNYDRDSEAFTVSSSRLVYVPTNSCEDDASGDFAYDADGDGFLSLAELSATSFANELLSASDEDGDGTATISETVESYGFTLPAF